MTSGLDLPVAFSFSAPVLVIFVITFFGYQSCILEIDTNHPECRPHPLSFFWKQKLHPEKYSMFCDADGPIHCEPFGSKMSWKCICISVAHPHLSTKMHLYGFRSLKVAIRTMEHGIRTTAQIFRTCTLKMSFASWNMACAPEHTWHVVVHVWKQTAIRTVAQMVRVWLWYNGKNRLHHGTCIHTYSQIALFSLFSPEMPLTSQHTLQISLFLSAKMANRAVEHGIRTMAHMALPLTDSLHWTWHPHHGTWRPHHSIIFEDYWSVKVENVSGVIVWGSWPFGTCSAGVPAAGRAAPPRRWSNRTLRREGVSILAPWERPWNFVAHSRHAGCWFSKSGFRTRWLGRFLA